MRVFAVIAAARGVRAALLDDAGQEVEFGAVCGGQGQVFEQVVEAGQVLAAVIGPERNPQEEGGQAFVLEGVANVKIDALLGRDGRGGSRFADFRDARSPNLFQAEGGEGVGEGHNCWTVQSHATLALAGSAREPQRAQRLKNLASFAALREKKFFSA